MWFPLFQEFILPPLTAEAACSDIFFFNRELTSSEKQSSPTAARSMMGPFWAETDGN